MIEYNSAMMIHATLFLTAAVLLAIAPGPGMLYVLARTLAGGKREGILSALGTLLGGMAHVFAAAAGISVILAKSASAFATVKYAGAAYLCYLGIRMILDAQKQEAALSNKEFLPQGTFPRRSAFWQGVTTEVLNPKTALFFLSFIPQFVNRGSGHVFAQFFGAGEHFSCAEYICGFDGNRPGWPAWKPHSYFRQVPQAAEDGDWRNHDRIGNIPCDQREVITMK